MTLGHEISSRKNVLFERDGASSSLSLLSLSSNGLTAPEIRKAFERVMGSKTFASVRRSRELLAYLVEQTLAGRADAINEHSLAQDVFGRDENFDPRIDTCVRTEAWRLRRRLADYYAEEGRKEAIRIGFAPRSFLPTFSSNPTAVRNCSTSDCQSILIDVKGQDGARESDRNLAERLQDELASALHQLPRIVPLTRSSDGFAPDLYLRCTVYRDASALRIVSSLVGDEKGAVLNSGTFAFLPGGRRPSPSAIAQAIAEMVSRGLSGTAEGLSVDLLDPIDRLRYLDQLLLRGSDMDRGKPLADLRKVIEYCEDGIARDPLDRAAQRRLVAAFGLFLSIAPTATPQIMPRLSKVAHDLLAVDDRLSNVWLTLGLAASYSYNWKEAEHACRQAIAISPLDFSGYILLALNLLQRGETAQALELAEAARLLDPHSPFVASGYALTLLSARRFDAAAQIAHEALEIDPDFHRLRLALGEAYMNKGQLDAALGEFDTTFKVMSQDSSVCGLLGLAYGLSGDIDRATGMLARVHRSTDMRPQSHCAEAMIQLGLGAHDDALTALDAAVLRGGTPGLFMTNAMFDSVRNDRRFSQIQKRMGFGR